MSKIKKESWLYYIVPSILLAGSILIMTSGFWWKLTDQSKDILHSIKKIEQVVKEEEWTNANDIVTDVIKKWEKSIKIIQFGVERDRVFEIDESLAKIKGAVLTENKTGVIQEVYVFYRIWDDLGY